MRSVDGSISIHALREEGDRIQRAGNTGRMYFYPRPPRGGRRFAYPVPVGSAPISIHALREEGDDAVASRLFESQQFLSTPSARRATRVRARFARACVYFYPRPPRGGRLPRVVWAYQRRNFYPRPPRGGRLFPVFISFFGSLFLSTPSARRATTNTKTKRQKWRYFYPRPPRGGRHCKIPIHRKINSFLSTPSARRATGLPPCWLGSVQFLSTPSARRATYRQHGRRSSGAISIHALREEGDWPIHFPTPTVFYFYPRPPRGGRPSCPAK